MIYVITFLTPELGKIIENSRLRMKIKTIYKINIVVFFQTVSQSNTFKQLI